MAFVYILKSKKNKYYIGSTLNLMQRLSHHKGGHTPSTKRMGELELVLSQEYSSLSAAREIEKRLKRMKRHDYIENIVNEGSIRMSPKTPR